ncbi:MAG TPA: ATP-binding protein, partial [Albitalea sp.]|nr:ATP-binding protein [Albitalea sp.]
IRDASERRAAEQARAGQIAAEAASRAKNDFLSRMSHELRTPLNAMLGFTQLLESDPRSPLSERQRQHVELVRQAGWHLMALIDDVLDVSRIEAGQLQVDLRPVPLTELLDSTLRLCETQAQRHGVTLHPVYREQPLVVASSDPVRLRQVMLNLLSNAIKYNRRGGQVRVSASHEGNRVRVDVVDDGLGMTTAQLARLFEPFNRLGREHGDVEGTGIGLALTRELVHLMHGQIEVDSDPGRGTQVRLILPAPPASAPADAGTEPALLASAAAGDVGPQGVVLYIEDNAVNLLLVDQFLSRWPGVRFEQAEDGQRGIDAARALRPDLVLLDMQLPDMDGHQVLRALRDDPVTARSRVVVLSASAMPEEVARIRRAGATDYWTKPLDFERFMADMRRLLDER